MDSLPVSVFHWQISCIQVATQEQPEAVNLLIQFNVACPCPCPTRRTLIQPRSKYSREHCNSDEGRKKKCREIHGFVNCPETRERVPHNKQGWRGAVRCCAHDVRSFDDNDRAPSKKWPIQ